MPEVQYHRLPAAEKREALQAAALLCGRRTQLLEKDATMLPTGMLLDDDEPFDSLMERCAMLETRANAPWKMDE